MNMKKLLYIITLGLLWLVGFASADITSIAVTPTTQSAISGSSVTFTITWTNTTGDMYMKYILPKTANYAIVYQNANSEPINNFVLTLVASEHDPIFHIPAHANFSITITAKVATNNWSFSTLNTQAVFASTMQISTVLTSAVAQITPIADLSITNILTGENPVVSGDIVSYFITIKNIWSDSAVGLTFTSTFPIPTLGTPTATFAGTPHAYNYINYPKDFVWSGLYLNDLYAWDSKTIVLTAPLMNNIVVGTAFSQIAKVNTKNSEYTTGNNSATATWVVQTYADVRVTKTLAPFTGFQEGDTVVYTISYGNSGGRTATFVNVIDSINDEVSFDETGYITAEAINTDEVVDFTVRSIAALPGGSGGIFTLTGTFTSTLSSWATFANKASIQTKSIETNTGNNSSTVVGTITGRQNITLNIIANNTTRPQLDNVPYGSGPSTMIQAVSGDVVQFTITYSNSGNAIASNSTLSLTWIQGFTTLSATSFTIGELSIESNGTVVVTGVVWPKNYISFVPTARLTYNSGQLATDSVLIQEPMVCGDGLITRTEVCDTQSSMSAFFAGQTCENQQGQCVLVTNSIINNACINYQYTNTLGVSITGQSCDSIDVALTQASCVSLTGTTPEATQNGYEIEYTCRGNSSSSATTPITIDCGNGTSVAWLWSMVQGTCRYESAFNGHAQCRVGNDINNPLCRLAVNESLLQCDLEALDGRIIIVDDNGDGEGRFRCETRDGVDAQTISIDCGIDGEGDASDTNTSQLETTCIYEDNTPPENKIVTCSTNDVICETEHIIIDEDTFGRCGDGIRQWYEQCDVLNMQANRTYPLANGQSCRNCSIVENEDSVGCFNVGNTNLSVQEDEILPFWRTIDKNKNFTSSCSPANTDKIRADSLTCDFEIYNGLWNTVKTITRPCDTDNRWTANIFKYLLNIGKDRYSLQNAFGKYYTTLSENTINGIYGEYKLRLQAVNYEYCDGTSWQDGTPMNRVCEVNFTVTKPYLAQKSSFAVNATPKATDISLDGYKTLDGEDLIKSTDLADIMVLDESNYDGGSKVDTMINTFITKYDRLALTVPQSSLKGTAFENMSSITVKVVPSQKIYILEATTAWTPVELKNINKFTTPFTIVTKNIDLVIKGNVDYNGMILVKWGTIEFRPADIVGVDRCPSPQVVKGIFVTDEGFIGTTPALRNDTTSKERCQYGNLNVKGILMGDNIDALVASRRSQLNDWFYVKSAVATAMKIERRNEVFNGAAVLIEYSPSLWSALPPGASEFTTALEVYKQ